MTELVALAGVLLTALGSLVAAYWQWVYKPNLDRLEAKRIADEAAHAEQMRLLDIAVQQLQNSHTTNLREDLDERFDRIERMVTAGDFDTHTRIDRLQDRFDRHIDGTK